jgi:hypothetical protein
LLFFFTLSFVWYSKFTASNELTIQKLCQIKDTLFVTLYILVNITHTKRSMSISPINASTTARHGPSATQVRTILKPNPTSSNLSHLEFHHQNANATFAAISQSCATCVVFIRNVLHKHKISP